jgi:hypothetical protein
MDDTAYFWHGSLNVDEAMRAHEARTGRKARQIVCRKADEPAVANQLRPADVELRSDNYVQRGTLYLAGVVLAFALWHVAALPISPTTTPSRNRMSARPGRR